MASKYELMIDPTPMGWAYGFPKALPEEAVMCGGKEYDLFINPSFDLEKWIGEQGYPLESFQYYSLYPQEAKNMCGGVYEEELTEESTNEKMGDMKFTTAKDFMDEQNEYYYPGSDPQE